MEDAPSMVLASISTLSLGEELRRCPLDSAYIYTSRHVGLTILTTRISHQRIETATLVLHIKLGVISSRRLREIGYHRSSRMYAYHRPNSISDKNKPPEHRDCDSRVGLHVKCSCGSHTHYAPCEDFAPLRKLVL